MNVEDTPERKIAVGDVPSEWVGIAYLVYEPGSLLQDVVKQGKHLTGNIRPEADRTSPSHMSMKMVPKAMPASLIKGFSNCRASDAAACVQLRPITCT